MDQYISGEAYGMRVIETKKPATYIFRKYECEDCYKIFDSEYEAQYCERNHKIDSCVHYFRWKPCDCLKNPLQYACEHQIREVCKECGYDKGNRVAIYLSGLGDNQNLLEELIIKIKECKAP